MKAILIDSKNREVKEIEVNGLQDLQEAVGGYIEPVGKFPGGDVLFVDEEGRMKKQDSGFAFNGQPLVGNGLIAQDQKDCKLTADEVSKMVKFFSIPE